MTTRAFWNELLKNLLRILKIFVTSSWISLFIILLILLLLTKMDQGSALLVSLLNAPFNTVLFLLLVTALTLVIGHYPIYLMMWRRDHSAFSRKSPEDQPVTWNMDHLMWGFGWVTFEDTSRKEEQTFVFKGVNFLRGILGIGLLLCLSVVLNYAVKKYIYPDFPTRMVNISVFVILTVIHAFLFANQERILANKKAFQYLKRAIFFLFWMATLAAGSALIFTVVIGEGWNPYTFLSFTIHLILGGILYCFYKNYRSTLKGSWWMFPFSQLANHKTYIILNAILGFIAFLIVLLSQFWTFFHPLVILLAFLHLTYGVFIVTLKHRFFYISNPKHRRHLWTRKLFLYIMPVIPVTLLVWNFCAGSWGNDLHLLEGTQKGTSVQMEEYLENFTDHLDTLSVEDSTLYFIASYGGGLKANAWNLLVLDSLSNFNGNNLLNQTVAMSGVSGGALGQHFYAALQKTEPDRQKRKQTIRRISQSNMLSRDMAWLLGYDLIREWLPGMKFQQADRAGKAMEEYAAIIGDERMLTTGYQEYWAELFQERYYPIQIANAAGTHQRRGIACSVGFEDFHTVFPNADNLCEIGDEKTLTYSQAVSCSHRFPIFSPAAKVEGKGHYVDGGYYENSGMLSLIDLYWHLQKQDLWQQKLKDWKIVFLQIRNDAKAYLRAQMNIDEVNVLKTKESGEIVSIFSTVVSIHHLPLYIENRLTHLQQSGIEFSTIDLPYRLREEQIADMMRAEEIDEAGVEKLQEKIKEVDSHILHALESVEGSDWRTIEPPLARYLSKPAVRYMEAMLCCDTVLFQDLTRSKAGGQ